MTRLKPVWIDKSLSLSFKIRLMRSLVTSIFLHACAWTFTAELQRRIQAMKIRCYCKILHISHSRPCYQRESPCQDPAGNQTTLRPPDQCKEMQTPGVWSCLLFITSGQNHFVRHNKGEGDKAIRGRGGKTSGNEQALSSPSPRGQWRTVKNGGNWLQNHLWRPNDPRG